MFVRFILTSLLLLSVADSAPLLELREPNCPSEFGPEPRTAAERERREAWNPYVKILPTLEAKLPKAPDATISMPVQGVRVAQVSDTFAAPRSGGRKHEGQDIFAKRGTPVYSATNGIVWRLANTPLGGNWIFVVGAGGRRYYYAHLDRYAPNLKEGQNVTTNTLLGYVGTTGNAETTPPHLHFEVNAGSQAKCDYRAINPLPLLRDR
ncbi:M23 family metallopeptidase [Deinococcus yavapaiensis]|uniref:Peptidase M23-like protein n=1 Tax=Deinococcus yavapaiensis KR-236 TaxID=694435 RepID=A0A318S761_9DEIO|nr:M23 family metallopeptidase [Deinococcus yavapaiensis]PYE52879.1 peptidase M23-like protein [Deinococcus yavapaiensis KR-236]